MKDTIDTMEDTISEDTMMDCGEGLDEFVDLATDISDSVPNIRDAAERLLTLLGVDDADDDTSSSEDEGVELDLDDADEPENTRFLHQLATSLVQELKYAQKSSTTNSTMRYNSEEQMHIDVAQEDSLQTSASFSQKYVINNYRQISHKKSDSHNNYVIRRTNSRDGFTSNKRCRIDQQVHDNNEDENDNNALTSNISNCWNTGWDACATEAVRYLVQVEGLAPHHPKVLSLKSHLDMQKKRALAQYTAQNENQVS